MKIPKMRNSAGSPGATTGRCCSKIFEALVNVLQAFGDREIVVQNAVKAIGRLGELHFDPQV